jgi:rhamnogalacturonyl hydrolase YesR
VQQYWWIDALFMGLPNWARWSARTGDTSYLAKMDALFDHVRNDGLTAVVNCAGQPPGLYDTAERLWLRDCRYIGARDADGQKVFWGRGNGWVIAAMPRCCRCCRRATRAARGTATC